MTVLGAHTLSEAYDLIRDYDPQLAWLGKCRDAAAASDKWAQADAAGWAQWLQDEAALENRYNSQSQSTRDAWKITPTAIADVTPNESAYQQVLVSWQNGPTPSPGGFDDLVRRAQAGPDAATFGGEPAAVQPVAPDPDLAGYQGADAATQAIGQAAGAVGSATKSLLSNPWVLGIGALVIGGLFVAKKVMP